MKLRIGYTWARVLGELKARRRKADAAIFRLPTMDIEASTQGRLDIDAAIPKPQRVSRQLAPNAPKLFGAGFMSRHLVQRPLSRAVRLQFQNARQPQPFLSCFPFAPLRSFHATPRQKYTIIDPVLDATHNAFLGLHHVLPWWAAIPFAAVAVRLAFLPLTLWSRRIMEKQRSLTPLITAWRGALERNIDPSKKAPNTKVLAARKTMEIYKAFSCQRYKLFLAPALQLPFFLVIIESIRRMAGAGQGLLRLIFSSAPSVTGSAEGAAETASGATATTDISTALTTIEPSMTTEGPLCNNAAPPRAFPLLHAHRSPSGHTVCFSTQASEHAETSRTGSGTADAGVAGRSAVLLDLHDVGKFRAGAVVGQVYAAEEPCHAVHASTEQVDGWCWEGELGHQDQGCRCSEGEDSWHQVLSWPLRPMGYQTDVDHESRIWPWTPQFIRRLLHDVKATAPRDHEKLYHTVPY
ncbi:hypothetical protein V492_00049 [Pseudogymnoascus sp. VKM F-4246]|nr:hypothetical protein V492_00049 [Pseudogymnoascus sp. VKM F-4246]